MDKDTTEFEANFSVLDRYGTDVTKDEYITDPAIGRDQQIRELILVLLTPEKSAILIGKPGIGKTAIVEGLAYRIQKRDVPEALLGYTILNIKTASLLGTMPSGESKVQKMIDELKTKEKMILFIDEIHMLIGSTETSSLDFANIFKEGLGRGSIKVIGATTTEEYERYILRDKAFTRRFQKIEVPEPTREETIKIMMGTLPKFEKQTGRKMKYTPFIQERIMSFIVDITSEYKRIFSLGSRYPDVCLTLLKQAFSYTVYDNRPSMDIFDIRKAIENSKNIYPDVIKKELPNFDKLFNDIMLEEKGEKPVEEWRKNGDPTRVELEEEQKMQIDNNQQKRNQDSSQNEDGEGKLETLDKVPELIDRVEFKNSRPISNIIDSRGKTKNGKKGSVSVSTSLNARINNTSNPKALDDMLLSSDVGTLKSEIPQGKVITNYVVTDEIRPGVDDNYLLRRPIESNLMEQEPIQEEVIGKYRSGNINRKKNEGRHMWDNNYRPERQDISNQNFDKYQNFFHPENNVNNGAPMNDPMGMPMNNGPMYGPMNGPMNDPMGMPMNNGPMYGPMNGPMNDPMGMPMNNGPMYGPMNGPMNDPMGMPMNNGPVYGPMVDPINGGPNEPLSGPMFGPTNSSPFNETNKPFGDNSITNISNADSLFGAPMYSKEETKEEKPEINPDGYGQLLADNMSLKNGEIVNEFPTFEKLNNLNNIATSSRDIMNDDQNMMQNSGQNPVNNFNPFGNPNMPMNQNTPMNQNRNWTFIENNNNNNNNNMMQNNNSSFFQKNILDDIPKNKTEKNISSAGNMATPTNNKDYYEDMKSGDFVNFSDLNQGKVKEEDTNKYMGVQTEENKPQFDLNLENGVEEDNKFDDFYE